MTNDLEIKIKSEDSQETIVLLAFIKETAAGKYTQEKPLNNDPGLKRLDLTEIDTTFDENAEDLLFGISY